MAPMRLRRLTYLFDFDINAVSVILNVYTAFKETAGFISYPI